MATIKQIDGRTIHRIQSGQVIVDLCSVVKELVENSVDAGATTIDVRFKNQGLDLIEVQDNGSGIAPDNYDAIALKHHTSKLSSYADIGSLETFGFRGEALASLCALSTLCITTCLAADVPKGTKITFEASGEVRETSVVAAQRGTTVAVEKLFHNLPVRRRELERNIKREWHKVIALLNQYACIQTNLKFTVSQQPTKGRRIVLFSTKGNPTTRENIINIFGAKSMAALVPLELSLEMRPTTLGSAAHKDLAAGNISLDVKIVGHVSRPVHGEGRQTPDRQMFFVNGRPCGLPQFSKTFNEVYRSYNSSQSPFIMADVQLDTHLYDVNVSPDKRTILLHDQNHMLDSVRAALVEIFDSQDYTIPTSHVSRTCDAPVVNLGQTRNSDQSQRDQDRESEVRSRSGKEVSEPSDEDSLSEDEADRGSGSSTTQSVTKPVTARKLRNTLDSWVHGKTSSGVATDMDELAESGSSDNDEQNERSVPLRSVTGNNAGTRPSVFSYTSPQRPSGSEHPHPERLRQRTEFNSASSLAMREPAIPIVKPMRTLRSDGEVSPHQRSAARFSRLEAAKISIGTTNKDVEDMEDDAASSEGQGGSDEDQASVVGNEQENSTDDGDGNDDTPTFGTKLSQRFSAGTGLKQSPIPIHERQIQKNPASLAAGTRKNEGPENESDQTCPSDEELSDSAATPSPSSKQSAVAGRQSPGIPQGVREGHATGNKSAAPPVQSHQLNSRRKDATFQMVHEFVGAEQAIKISPSSRLLTPFRGASSSTNPRQQQQVEDIGANDAESKLSLIISKPDFSKMRVVGQFNLGFIIAVRPAEKEPSNAKPASQDELFIIDQHASDEKYNFERLQGSTVVQSQRLVHPKLLELTALEEEIVMENVEAIEANGFKIAIDVDGGAPVGSRCQLTALPLSRETTFSITDLEELIALLADESSGSAHIPRPSKVRKMFAMRACRSSVMIGKSLTTRQMYSLLGHMGELDKPWNCPHGRPTMRHLFSMHNWDAAGWRGDMDTEPARSWTAYARGE